MIVVHQSIPNPNTEPGHPITLTLCSKQPTERVNKAAPELWIALKHMMFSPQTVLCSGCWYNQVGQIKFDDGPSYGEEIAHMINEAKQEVKLVLNREYGKYIEIEDSEILEEE